MMNDKAKELGLKDTNFKNCHGLDEKDHYSSANDMAIIAKELVKHNKILKYSSIYETYLRKGTDKQIWLVNTNKLVRFKKGVDGLKTGYTENSGYCLTATMKQDNMRLIAVVLGEPSSEIRNNEISNMLDYGFSQYKLDTLFKKDSVIENINLENSNIDKVGVVPISDVTVLKRKIDNKKIDYRIEYNKLNDNIKRGEIIGKIILKSDNNDIKSIDLTINKDVKRASYFILFGRNIKKIITGNINI